MADASANGNISTAEVSPPPASIPTTPPVPPRPMQPNGTASPDDMPDEVIDGGEVMIEEPKRVPLRGGLWGEAAIVLAYLCILGLVASLGEIRVSYAKESDITVPWWTMSAIGLVPLLAATIGKAATMRYPGSFNVPRVASLRRQARRDARQMGTALGHETKAADALTALGAHMKAASSTPSGFPGTVHIERPAAHGPWNDLIRQVGAATSGSPLRSVMLVNPTDAPTDITPAQPAGGEGPGQAPEESAAKAQLILGGALARADRREWASRSNRRAARSLPKAMVSAVLVEASLKRIQDFDKVPEEGFKTLISPKAWAFLQTIFFAAEFGIGTDLGLVIKGIDLANSPQLSFFQVAVPCLMGGSLGVATFYAALAMGDAIGRWLGPVGQPPMSSEPETTAS